MERAAKGLTQKPRSEELWEAGLRLWAAPEGRTLLVLWRLVLEGLSREPEGRTQQARWLLR